MVSSLLSKNSYVFSKNVFSHRHTLCLLVKSFLKTSLPTNQVGKKDRWPSFADFCSTRPQKETAG